MDVPEWLWQGVATNLFVDSLGLAAWLAWKYRGEIAEIYGDMLTLLAEMLRSAAERTDSITHLDHQAELEDLREALRNLTPKVHILSAIRDSLKIPVLRYEPFRVRYVPAKYSYQPMRLRYRPMRLVSQNGLPRLIPPGIEYEPPRLRYTPPHIGITPHRFRVAEG